LAVFLVAGSAVDPFRLGLGSGLDRFGCNMTESIWLVSVRARIGLGSF